MTRTALARLAFPLLFACATPRVAAPDVEPTASSPAVAVAPTRVSTPTVAAPGYASAEVQAIRDAARRWLGALGANLWADWTRLPGAAPVTPVGSAGFTPEALATIRTARDAAQGDDRRALDRLELFVTGELVAAAVNGPTDELRALEQAQALTIGEEKEPWRDLDRLLASEASADVRGKIAEAEAAALAALAPGQDRVTERTAQALAALGEPAPTAYALRLRGTTAAQARELAESVLAATEASWLAAADRLAKERLAIPLAKVRRADLPRLLRAVGSDAFLPAAQSLARVTTLCAAWQLDCSDHPGFTVDLVMRPAKNARPIFVPVAPPGDVRLSLAPLAGADALRETLHETALALLASDDASQRWEDRQLDEGSVREAFAYTIAGLAEEPVYLAAAPTTTLTDVTRTMAARRLFQIRRHAARVLVALADGDPAAALRGPFERALGIPLTTGDLARWRVEADPMLTSLTPLRAWVLAAQIRGALAKAAGPAWWTSADAGKRLRELWRNAGEKSIDDIAKAIGAASLDPAVLAAELKQKAGT